MIVGIIQISLLFSLVGIAIFLGNFSTDIPARSFSFIFDWIHYHIVSLWIISGLLCYIYYRLVILLRSYHPNKYYINPLAFAAIVVFWPAYLYIVIYNLKNGGDVNIFDKNTWVEKGYKEKIKNYLKRYHEIDSYLHYHKNDLDFYKKKDNLIEEQNILIDKLSSYEYDISFLRQNL